MRRLSKWCCVNIENEIFEVCLGILFLSLPAEEGETFAQSLILYGYGDQ